MAEQYVIQFDEWKPAPGWPDYEVSSDGQVRRATPPRAGKTEIGKILRQTNHCRSGHKLVGLTKDGKTYKVKVHQLVSRAFIGEPPSDRHMVAHWDGDPTNNRVSNLRWATAKENVADTIRHGRIARGERSGVALLTEEQVLEIRRLRKAGVRNTDVAKMFGISCPTVSNITSGANWGWL